MEMAFKNQTDSINQESRLSVAAWDALSLEETASIDSEGRRQKFYMIFL